jgi:hypothetical protein
MKYKTLIEIKSILDGAVNNFGAYDVLDKSLHETMDFSKILKMVQSLPIESQIWIVQKLEDYGEVGCYISSNIEWELKLPNGEWGMSPNPNIGTSVEAQNALEFFSQKFGIIL